MSVLNVVGIGPGGLNHMTLEAREALERSEVVVGYQTYLRFIEPLLEGKEVVSTGMTREVERCRSAIRAAASGKRVALVSSGDAGIYGMAGLVLELLEKEFRQKGYSHVPEVVVVPGVSALQAAAAVLGAPLMHDFAVISLSDLLTPWDAIERRLALAAAGDFVMALYNPRSKGRVRQIEEAQRIVLSSRSAATPVGIVRNACRSGQEIRLTTLGEMLNCSIDMFSVVIIGNSSTFVDAAGRMVTPRGYEAGAKLGEAEGTRSGEPGTKAGAGSQDRGTGEPSAYGDPVGFGSQGVMFCGTASDVGKSVLTAGFCRILRNRGISVAPFKSQNMALNSAVTPDGKEIGRAQAVQAEACRIPPTIHMNPILLKPNSDTGSQVIVHGRAVGNMSVAEYNRFKPAAFEKVVESYRSLRSGFDCVVIEGAGSIAEINLKAHDIANMKVAEMADCPVILVADIDRGGVFAQIVGTTELLEPHERARVKGIIINKFRGDASLLKPGIEFVELRTGIPVLGVVPWFSGFRIPDEDSVPLQKRVRKNSAGAAVKVGVIRLPRLSNYTDFDPFESDPAVSVAYIDDPAQIEGLDLLIIPVTKSTIPDLAWLEERGLAEAIRRFDGTIAGICGGYQILGRRISDPEGVESGIAEIRGLGLLDVETVMLPLKTTHKVRATLADPEPSAIGDLTGYEIHMGETTLGAHARSFLTITHRSGASVEIQDGAVSADGRVFGTYVHGIFDNPGFRTGIVNRILISRGKEPIVSSAAEDPFDLLASHLENSLDIDRLLEICQLPEPASKGGA